MQTQNNDQNNQLYDIIIQTKIQKLRTKSNKWGRDEEEVREFNDGGQALVARCDGGSSTHSRLGCE